MTNIVTAKHVAQHLEISESTICRLAADGELPGYKIGELWRFDMDKILKVIEIAHSNNKEVMSR